MKTNVGQSLFFFFRSAAQDRREGVSNNRLRFRYNKAAGALHLKKHVYYATGLPCATTNDLHAAKAGGSVMSVIVAQRTY